MVQRKKPLEALLALRVLLFGARAGLWFAAVFLSLAARLARRLELKELEAFLLVRLIDAARCRSGVAFVSSDPETAERSPDLLKLVS